MAINLSTKYPGQTTAPTTEYPYGSAKNESAPEQLDGTPWERELINDWLGFFQRLLVLGDVTPNGTPDDARNNSQYVEALRTYLDGLYPRIGNVSQYSSFDTGSSNGVQAEAFRYRADGIAITAEVAFDINSGPGTAIVTLPNALPEEIRPNQARVNGLLVADLPDLIECPVNILSNGEIQVRRPGDIDNTIVRGCLVWEAFIQ